MNDPSTLPFSARELPDETMQEVAVIQTPDHPPTAGSADPNGPRFELHRHESYRQLNQVNKMCKNDTHKYEKRRMNHVWLKTVKRGAHAVLDCKTHNRFSFH